MTTEELQSIVVAIDELLTYQDECKVKLRGLRQLLISHARHSSSEPTNSPSRPRVDHSLLCVIHHGKPCFLGNTLALKFIDRLLQRPNCYVSYDKLLEEIWGGVRSHAAVRSLVKTLRAKLREAGLEGLASSIDGSVKGHFAIRDSE